MYIGARKNGENIGIIVESKYILNGLEINLKCVIIIINHGFSVLKVCCALHVC